MNEVSLKSQEDDIIQVCGLVKLEQFGQARSQFRTPQYYSFRYSLPSSFPHVSNIKKGLGLSHCFPGVKPYNARGALWPQSTSDGHHWERMKSLTMTMVLECRENKLSDVSRCFQRWSQCYTVELFRETCSGKFHDAIASCNMAAETFGAVARVGCCSTIRETFSGNFLKKFHKTYRVTRCNVRRVAVSPFVVLLWTSATATRSTPAILSLCCSVPIIFTQAFPKRTKVFSKTDIFFLRIKSASKHIREYQKLRLRVNGSRIRRKKNPYTAGWHTVHWKIQFTPNHATVSRDDTSATQSNENSNNNNNNNIVVFLPISVSEKVLIRSASSLLPPTAAT